MRDVASADGSGADLTHVDETGAARMVDVGQKDVSERTAVAQAVVEMAQQTLDLVRQNGLAKGDVLSVARIAGVLGAKQTPALIPLCHPIALTHVALDLALEDDPPRVVVTATARCRDRTGVEMEALTGAAVAALTVYDMAKAVDRSMTIASVRLLEKSGGRSGRWTRSP